MGKKKKKQASTVGGDHDGAPSSTPVVVSQGNSLPTAGSTRNDPGRRFRKRPWSAAKDSSPKTQGPFPRRHQVDDSPRAASDFYCLRTRPQPSSSVGGQGYAGRAMTSRPGKAPELSQNNHHHHHHHRTMNTCSVAHSDKTAGWRWQHHRGRGNRQRNGQRQWRGDSFRDGCGEYQQRPHQSEGNVETPQSSSSQSAGSTNNFVDGNSSNDLDIPGFYYDAEKKKYFKILPGHHSANSNMITRDIIKLKRTEEARQQSLREFALKTIRMDPSYTTSYRSAQKPRCRYSNNLLDHAQCMQTGAVRLYESRLVQHRVISHQLRSLCAFCKQRVFERDCGPYQRLEHMVQMVASPGDDNACVLGLWSLEELIVQRIQLFQVALRRCTKDTLDGATNDSTNASSSQATAATQSLSVTPIGAVVLQSFSKVTHVCWAPASTDQTANVPILYTTTYFIGNNPSLALLRTLDSESACDRPVTAGSPYTEFHLGQQSTWTCAWSIHKQKFSIGCKDSALVIDVATRRLWELFTKKSDVYTQAFSNGDGNTLYSGTQKGLVVGHDLRSSSTRYVTSLSHRSPVCHVHLLRDDMHLVAGDFSGRLCMWDLRMRSVVQDYIGHNNEYVRLPFKVDHSESVICAVGQDCYTRVWDLQTGALLSSVPPPYPASRDLIPAVAIYTSPHGQLDRPGILMGIKDEIHFYAA